MTVSSQTYPVPKEFYRAFEDRFRGSQELISERLEAYLPFLRALKSDGQVRRGLDLGCGRGEWLRLLEREGFEAHGVDLDDGMLQAANQQGLSVENKDAIAALVDSEDASVDLISGFHIIEHIPFPSRLALIREARRVLRPGGLLILETPNPENTMVGTWTFYMDPTHISPIPPIVMPFLASYAGFVQSTILRLNTSPPSDGLNLVDVFTKVGPDYALVARTKGGSNRLLDEAFETNVGLDIFDLLHRFDYLMEERFSTAEGISAALKTDIERISAETERLKAENKKLSARLESAHAELSEIHRHLELWTSPPLKLKLFFRRSGRPRKLVRLLAFHKNGRPREGGILGRIAHKKKGSCRPVFERWMNSAQYASLPWPSAQANRTKAMNIAAAQSKDQAHSASPNTIHLSEGSLRGPDPSTHPRRYEVWSQLASGRLYKGK